MPLCVGSRHGRRGLQPRGHYQVWSQRRHLSSIKMPNEKTGSITVSFTILLAQELSLSSSHDSDPVYNKPKHIKPRCVIRRWINFLLQENNNDIQTSSSEAIQKSRNWFYRSSLADARSASRRSRLCIPRCMLYFDKAAYAQIIICYTVIIVKWSAKEWVQQL